MKRTILWITTTLLLALTFAPAAAAAVAVTRVAHAAAAGSQFDAGGVLSPAAPSSATLTSAAVPPAELAAVTGGCRKNCGGGRQPLGTEWRLVSQVDSQSHQLGYGIVQETSNVYGRSPLPWEFSASDSCRHVFISGGAGISAGLNVNIGTTYHCATSVKLSGKLQVGYRVKIYRGDMRMTSTMTVAEYVVYSDGSTEATGARDVGVRERRWYRYTPVVTYGN